MKKFCHAGIGEPNEKTGHYPATCNNAAKHLFEVTSADGLTTHRVRLCGIHKNRFAGGEELPVRAGGKTIWLANSTERVGI